MGDCRERLRNFSDDARYEAGRQLFRVQNGLDPQNWKPIRQVGPGVREIRIREDGQFRVFYVTNVGNALCVLHAFQKKTRKTTPSDITMGQELLKQIRG
ncbi:MAG: type II toxin-antitoxin system RelE/ParE family toxin [Desulfobulbus sp.]|nr:type II toxin-antitoxin system RelE/ParE family toxin [Desulfobulbus sp.]